MKVLDFFKEKLNQSQSFLYFWRHFLYLLPKKWGRKLLYRILMKKELNLENPRDFNEKINWLMVYEHGEREGELADKVLVKEIIKKQNIPDLHIPKTYKVYKNANEIDMDELPNQFVLKCNHACGNVFICTDKSNFNLDEAKTVLNEDLKRNYAFETLEYHYKYINPLIMAEEYLNDSINKNPIDYKFYCFNGKADNILICSNRDEDLKLDDYDLSWNLRDYTYDDYKANVNFKKPKNLNRMIEIAEELSHDHIFVRVDLYEINGNIYFGELTFTPFNGIINYYRPEILELLGDKLKLPIDN